MKTIKLWENTPYFDPAIGQDTPELIEMPVENAKGCVIVLPGGGYEMRAEDHEGVQIAKKLNGVGYYAYILRYRIAPYRHPVMQTDVNRAVRVVRSLAEEGGYPSDRIGVMGFSAGGHLAMTACTRFDFGRMDGDEIDRISCRPDMGILCYPVISLGSAITHMGSTKALLGADFDPALAAELSGENAVRPDTPPCFIWHTASDDAVPVANSLRFADALAAKKIPFELHVFPKGRHGMGLAIEESPYVARWFGLLAAYLENCWGSAPNPGQGTF